MRFNVVAMVWLLACGASASFAAQPLHKGWFVVVAAFPTQPESRQQGDVEKVAKLAAPCRVDPFNDLSEKFRTFAPNLNVFVLGAYARRNQAQAVAHSVRGCFPDAYVKFGDHGGE